MLENTLSWSDLSQLPESPGIYTWYFRPTLTKYDINKLIREINLNGEASSFVEPAKLIKDFLNNKLFKYFEQKPYEVELKGALKPRYLGRAHHRSEDNVSPDLIQRIYSNPNLLFDINTILEHSTPAVASPLYIGKAKNLRSRIQGHKKMIRTLKNNISLNVANYVEYTPSPEEVSFANRIVERDIPSSQLFVTYIVVQNENIVTELENILNRIYFPILGRN